MTGTNPTMWARVFAITAAGLVVAGCQATAGLGYAGGWDQNVSDETAEWGQYRHGSVYRLERDVFLLDVPERTNGPALVPGLDAPVPPGTFRGPAGMDDYLAAPSAYRGVIGVVSADTRLRAETLRAKGNVLDKKLTRRYVRARVLDGEFRGRVVDLEPVSIYRTDPEGGPAAMVGPNADFLRLN